MAGMVRGTIFAALVAGFGLTAAAGADAASRYMQTGALTSQPIGHYEFCEKFREECSVRSANSVAPRVTDYGWNAVRAINVAVNHRITPMTDEDIFGRDEVWTYPVEVGDCEDFALQKRRELIARGFAVADLLITVVRKPDGEGHAVLTLRTSEGDYVLDNLDDRVRLWTDTPYRFLKRQASFNSGRWVNIENSDDLLVGAVEN